MITTKQEYTNCSAVIAINSILENQAIHSPQGTISTLKAINQPYIKSNFVQHMHSTEYKNMNIYTNLQTLYKAQNGLLLNIFKKNLI